MKEVTWPFWALKYSQWSSYIQISLIVKQVHWSQPLSMTLITSLGWESGNLESTLLIYLRGTGGWLHREVRKKAAFSTHSSVDKALFLLPKVPSAHLLADLKLLVNSILSISWVAADNNADMDKTVGRRVSELTTNGDYAETTKLISLVT